MSNENETLLNKQEGEHQSNADKYMPKPESYNKPISEGHRSSKLAEGRSNAISSGMNRQVRAGAQRTSRTAQKLKLLPEEPFHREDDGPELRDRDVYSQVNRITDKNARRDAEKLGKAHRHLLPRCTAYCTASSYNMKDLIRWLKDSKKVHHTHPKLFDECLYTPFRYNDWRGDKRFEHDDIIRLDDEGGEINVSDKHPDIFVFEYGVIVLWGFTEREEKAFLNDIEKFEKEKLAEEDVQVEEFNYYVTQSYQPRIYNDFITLRDGSNYMIKLSISHAVAQSVKISLFEELVDNTIEDTQDIPQEIASSGKVSMSKEDIMKSIGELFILRININLHGSVLDSPEIMWSEPQLEPIYQATRGYLEINQRVALLNQRLEVISDMLQMLKEQLGHSHEEYLELIVIVLVIVQVLIALVNIAVDMIANKIK
ncbi:Rmd1p [Nakaseomyces bracarensis]|uniref:Rmd1p n=1 Tax=Nakaseomyces bracarensis TaxID=273131 RepID=UPI003871AAD6